jgi:hypothetical protein
MNDATGKEKIYLSTVINSFLEGTNFNYSCIFLNNPGGCRQDYVMLKEFNIYYFIIFYISNIRGKGCHPN